MPDQEVVIRGGSLYIEPKKLKKELKRKKKPDGDYEYEYPDAGDITTVDITNGRIISAEPLKIEITNSKGCIITIHYEVP